MFAGRAGLKAATDRHELPVAIHVFLSEHDLVVRRASIYSPAGCKCCRAREYEFGSSPATAFLIRQYLLCDINLKCLNLPNSLAVEPKSGSYLSEHLGSSGVRRIFS